MPTTTRDLASILQTVQRPGDFHATGRSDIFPPQLEVAGVGTISLPLLPTQAEQLVAVAEPAPYGRGSETLIDTDVRRTWQIGADRVHIGGRHWPQSLAAIVARSAAGLGVSEAVSAELYKMLIYDTGSFFVRHRDTEKAPGMFATLVVVLPSIYTGGELVIRHRDREVCLDLSTQDSAEVAFAAFYADCWHEVRPISSGCRLALIYNLIRQGPGKLPEPPAYDTEEQRLTGLLRRWAAELAATESDAPGDCPGKLIYPLEHAYTPAEIGFTRLKNADAAVATVLVAAAKLADCEVHLAFVAIEESGSAEHSYSYASSRRRYSPADDRDEDFEVGEVYERSLTLSDWQTPDGSRPALSALPFKEDELCPPDAMDDEEPDEQLFFEATGNEGATFERSYRRAALVLWPRARKLNVIVGAGREIGLAYLEGLAKCWAASNEDLGSPLWEEAHRLAGLLIDRTGDGGHWPAPVWPPTTAPGQAARMVASLCQLHDTDNIASFMAKVSANGHYRSDDNEALVDAAMLLPPKQAAELLERIITRNTRQEANGCAELLERFSARLAADPAAEIPPSSAGVAAAGACGALLQPAAAALLAALPGDPALAPKPEGWQRPTRVTPALVVDLLTALCRLGDLAPGERAVDHLLAWPETYAADAILVPAALRLAEHAGAVRDWAPTRRLKAVVVDHLDQRIAEALTAPADFTRASQIACECNYCADLAAFLADPLRKTWVFKAAQAHRSHVEDSIRRHPCDVDQATERRGSPHALVCTKNQASFERRLAQRKADLANRARLTSSAKI